MEKSKSGGKNFGSMFMSLLNKGIEILSGTVPIIGSLADNLEDRAEKMHKRMLGFAMFYLSLFAGIIFLILGIFFLLVDSAGIPRGVVFSVGGLLVLLVSMLLIQFWKNKHGRQS